MGRLADAGRYYALRHPTVERLAHRVELMVRTSAQRRAIERIGPVATAKMGHSEVSLDLRILREYLMYESLRGSGFGYEPGSTQLILSALRPDSVFIDVGANIGYFTVVALEKLGPSGAALAYEPNPDTFRRLERTVEPHDPHHIARLINAAVSDADGSATLFHSPVDDARDSLTPVGGSGVPVRTVRLDGQGLDGRPVVIKIDAEGAEERVLEGMKGLIEAAGSLAIVLEWNPPMAGPSLWKQIEGRFSVYRIDEGVPGRVDPVTSISAIRRRLTNLWLVRREDRAKE